MKELEERRQKELHTIEFMIDLYCRKHHTKEHQRCSACEALLQYARKRISLCPCMESKTFCSTCKVHCYEHAMREKIRDVMRFSGPRMLIYHPIMAIHHVVDTIKEKRK